MSDATHLPSVVAHPPKAAARPSTEPRAPSNQPVCVSFPAARPAITPLQPVLADVRIASRALTNEIERRSAWEPGAPGASCCTRACSRGPAYLAPIHAAL
jgi:hypothetical protein